MHSHSFQDTKFKFLIQVKEFQQQVVDGLTVLRYPGSEIKGSSLKKTLIQHAFAQSFQDTELKLHRYVNDSPGQVVEGLAILRYPVELRN